MSCPGVRLGEMAHGIGERAGGIHDDFCLRAERLAGLDVLPANAVDDAVAAFVQPGDFGIVEQRGALFGRGGDQIDEQPRIVKLAVVINHAPGESVGIDVGKTPERFLLGNELRCAETIFAGEHLINLEADAVERPLPPGVAGNNKRQLADEMRRVLAQESAFLQRLHHERDVALFEITHAAVHQFGAAAGGALAEVMLFEQQRRVAARGRIHRHARAGGAAADNNHVPGFDRVPGPVSTCRLVS